MLAAIRQQKKEGVANYVWQTRNLPATFQGSYDGANWGARPTTMNFSNNISSIRTPGGNAVYLSNGSIGKAAVTQNGNTFVLSSAYPVGNYAGQAVYASGRVIALSNRIGISGSDYVLIMEIS